MLTIPLIWTHVYICNIYEPVRPGIHWPLFGLMLLTATAIQGMAHAICLITNGNLLLMTALTVFIYTSFSVIGNFFLTLANLHYIYQFASNFAIFRFMFESFMLLQYGFGRCGPHDIQTILHMMAISDADLPYTVTMLIFDMILYRVLTLGLLHYRMNPIQNRRQRMERILGYLDQ